MDISENARASAAHLGEGLGPIDAVTGFWTRSEAEQIDIARFDDCPAPGVNTISTVSLCDHDLYPDSPGIRLQIIAAYPAALTGFPEMFAKCALRAAYEGLPLRRGAVHPDVLLPYGVSRTLEHLFYVAPFLWEDRVAPLQSGDTTIGWLMAVPISEPERAFAERHGAAALEALLAEEKVNVLDFERETVASKRLAP